MNILKECYMTLIDSRVQTNNINSYIGLRDITLSNNIEEIYYFSNSDTYLCVYEGHISLLRGIDSKISGSQIIWIKNIEGKKKVIPLSLRTIVCIYDTYISILDGLTYEEQIYVIRVPRESAYKELKMGFPIVNAFVYERDSCIGKSIKLGVLLHTSDMFNCFTEIKLPIEIEDIEIKESLSPVFFSGFSRTQTNKLINTIPEPILSVEVMEDYTQLITHNYVWLVGLKEYLSKYETGIRELRIEGVSTTILRKRLSDWSYERCQLKNRRVVY